MAAAFHDAATPAGLQKLNDHLASHSYLSGYLPSADDVLVAQAVPLGSTGENHPHVRRWLHHILGFSPLVRAELAAAAGAGAGAGHAKDEHASNEPRKFLDVSDDDDDDFNLDDDDDDADKEAQALIKKKALDAYNEKLKAKPKAAAKSSIVWEIKPEDDETDMKELEAAVRAIEMEGLEWQASELVPVAYGILKLRIISQVVDDLVATDDLQERIEAVPGVQSTDIFAFNKV